MNELDVQLYSEVIVIIGILVFAIRRFIKQQLNTPTSPLLSWEDIYNKNRYKKMLD